MFGCPKNSVPSKPDTPEEQIAMLWDGLFNHVHHRLNWVDTKLNFVLLLMGITLALIGGLVGLVITAL